MAHVCIVMHLNVYIKKKKKKDLSLIKRKFTIIIKYYYIIIYINKLDSDYLRVNKYVVRDIYLFL